MSVLLSERDLRVIEEASNLLQVAPAVIEKDTYVTQALHALAGLENEHFYLVFHGGTCLAKAHQLIERMSEDCDFRMQTKISLTLRVKKRVDGHYVNLELIL